MRKTLLAALLLLPLMASAQSINYYPAQGTSGGSFTTPFAAPAADNCAAIPYSFTGDTNTGLCTSAADTWNLYTAGASRLSGNSTAITSTVQYVAPAGTAATPAYRFTDDNTGFFEPAVGNVGVSVNGTERFRFGSAGTLSVLEIALGSPAVPTAYINQEAGAGIVQHGVDANGAPVHQTIKAHDGITGTDVAGANLTLAGGRGTGAGTPGTVVLSTATTGTTGTTAQTLTPRVTISEAGMLLAAITQAALGTPANGTIAYCSDCTIANPCAGGGTGALAKRLNGGWVCN